MPGLLADYRKLPRALSHTYYHPLTPSTHSELSKLFHAQASTDPISTEIVTTRKIPLWGRQLSIPSCAGSVARFRFSDLCAKPLSAADYLEVTHTFGTIFVEEVPRMGIGERDQARRFITFIDGLSILHLA
jgi:protein AFG1